MPTNNINTLLIRSGQHVIGLRLNGVVIGELWSAINNLSDSKQNNILGGATSIIDNDLATNKALISSNGGKVAASTVTATELGHLVGVTSAIQTQLNEKALNSHVTELATPTLAGHVRLSCTAEGSTTGNPSDAPTAATHGAVGFGVIAGGTINLNDYRRTGEWLLYNISTATNFPTGTWTGSSNGAYLKVICYNNATNGTQYLYKQNSTEVWVRRFMVILTVTTFTTWSRVDHEPEVVLAGFGGDIDPTHTSNYVVRLRGNTSSSQSDTTLQRRVYFGNRTSRVAASTVLGTYESTSDTTYYVSATGRVSPPYFAFVTSSAFTNTGTLIAANLASDVKRIISLEVGA